MKPNKSSKKGKAPDKRATKDLPPRKSQGVKGGFVAVEHGGGATSPPIRTAPKGTHLPEVVIEIW
jgi:hypothetical protein